MSHGLKLFIVLGIILIAGFFPVHTALAQDEQETIVIQLNRDFGYGGLGNDIQGLFSIHATAPEAVERIDFLLDGELMGTVTEPPFRYQFQTDNFPSGIHTISATGFTKDGSVINSNEVVAEFVSSDSTRKQMITMVGTILVIVLGGVALAAGIPFLLGRKSKSSVVNIQSYGLLGGTVCPKCGKPFPRHWWGLNVVAGKLDRCPHCGKWSLVYRSTPEELRFAEAQLAHEQMPDVSQRKSDEQLQKDIDNSKYME